MPKIKIKRNKDLLMDINKYRNQENENERKNIESEENNQKE